MPPRKANGKGKASPKKAENQKGIAPAIVDTRPKPEQDDKGRFVTGNIGGGRRKGSRNKLGEAFIDDMYDAWLEKGPEVIRNAMAESPGPFIRSMVSILPQEVHVKNNLENLSDEELSDIIAALRSVADPASVATLGAGTEGADEKARRRRQLN